MAVAVERSSGVLASRRASWRTADVWFRVAISGAAFLLIVVVVATGVFIIAQAWPSLTHYGPLSFLGSSHWAPSRASIRSHSPNPYGILQFIYGSLITSIIAMVIAVPVSMAVALLITDIAAQRIRRPLSYLVDLLAAIPSVVYGFWGIFALIPALKPIVNALTDTLGKVPVIGALFQGPFFGVSYFTAGVVLSIMVIPIISALCREVFAAVPAQEKEAALALGGTRWEMLRMAVLPRSVSGVFGASILGLGRALGETIAVTMVIGNSVQAIAASIFSQGATMPSVIANEFTEATEPFHLSSLFVVALALLIFSVVVNGLGRLVIGRVIRPVSA